MSERPSTNFKRRGRPHPNAEARRFAAMRALSFKHPDTAAGAAAALVSLADAQTRAEFARAGYVPDPAVKGVWIAVGDLGQRAVIYLAGYADPFGRVREYNDFEISGVGEER